MSFILDALKKSEAERQRKATPGFADIPDGRGRSGAPRWMWPVAGLLAVNLGVLMLLLLRPAADPEQADPVSRPLQVPEAAGSPSFSELVTAAKDSQRETDPAASPPATVAAPAEAVPTPEPEPARAEPRIDMGSLATFNQLRAQGVLQVPDLHVDLHVYGDQSGDRFVVINMSRYKEGAMLTEGPRVREILPDGIVLEHQGTTFFLPSP